VQTDAVVAAPDAEDHLRAAVAGSFERVTVDGQQSTNDAVFLQATGASGAELPAGLLDAILLQLALDLIADGEGASRTARVSVAGAADAREAERVARAIANSQLVQTALFGRDPNWGRVVQAAGAALAGERLDLTGADVDATELGEDVAEAELAIRLGRGDGEGSVYFSDLTHDYVKLNAEYTT
jgi:glutamate N-acetyltransferase/amino-acid N-acetyltransferase